VDLEIRVTVFQVVVRAGWLAVRGHGHYVPDARMATALSDQAGKVAP
jgi:hypothetical protein